MSTKTETQPKPPMALVLKDDPEKVVAWACGVCERVAPQPRWSSAEEAARICCLCPGCKSVAIVSDERRIRRVFCRTCDERNSARRQIDAARADRERWERAEKVSADEYEGLLFSEELDRFFSDAGEAQGWLEYEGVKRPWRLYACKAMTGRLDLHAALENAAEELQEDHWWVDQAELEAFVAAWNKKQTCETWYPDYGRAVLLDGGEVDR